MSQAATNARPGVLPPSPRGGLRVPCEDESGSCSAGDCHHAAGGDAAGGLSPSPRFAVVTELEEASQQPAETDMNAASVAAASVAADTSIATTVVTESEVVQQLLLHRALQEADRFCSERSYAGSQGLSEAIRGPQSSIRV